MKEIEKLKNLTKDQKIALRDDIVRTSEGSFSDIIDSKVNYDADVEDIKSTFGISKSTVKKFIKEHYEESLSEAKEELKEFEEMYKQVMG